MWNGLGKYSLELFSISFYYKYKESDIGVSKPPLKTIKKICKLWGFYKSKNIGDWRSSYGFS